MPSCRPDAIPAVISLVRQIDPTSILDVGIGFGKWGFLFREYTDIVHSENQPERYRRENWKIKIHGIEGYPQYLTPVHEFIYDEIFKGDACELLPTLGNYDLIYMGDMIEHLTKEKGKSLIAEAGNHCDGYLIVSTPRFETNQPELCGNPLEKHRSLWTKYDFKDLGATDVIVAPGEILLAVFPMKGRPRILPQTRKTRPEWRAVLAETGRMLLGEELYTRIRSRL